MLFLFYTDILTLYTVALLIPHLVGFGLTVLRFSFSLLFSLILLMDFVYLFDEENGSTRNNDISVVVYGRSIWTWSIVLHIHTSSSHFQQHDHN